MSSTGSQNGMNSRLSIVHGIDFENTCLTLLGTGMGFWVGDHVSGTFCKLPQLFWVQ